MTRWLVVLVACHVDAPSSPPPTCAQIGGHARDLYDAALHEAFRILDDTPARLGEMFARHCKAEAWSVDAKRCLIYQSTAKDWFCRYQLSGTQRGALDQETWRYLHPIVTADDFATAVTDVMEHFIAFAQSDDCRKIAVDLGPYMVTSWRVRASIKDFFDDHADEARARLRAMPADKRAAMSAAWTQFELCKGEPAFDDALETFPAGNDQDR